MRWITKWSYPPTVDVQKMLESNLSPSHYVRNGVAASLREHARIEEKDSQDTLNSLSIAPRDRCSAGLVADCRRSNVRNVRGRASNLSNQI